MAHEELPPALAAALSALRDDWLLPDNGDELIADEGDSATEPDLLAADDPRLWVRIAWTVRQRIKRGELLPGTNLPILRLREEWHASQPTVARALQHLEATRYVRRYPGSVGYVVLKRERAT